MIDNPIDEIKKRIDIVDFINSFIPLKKTGRNFKAICPFHQERTPSFIVSPERQIWHCFGACNEGGDVIKFLMKWENITFIEALRELAKKTGVSLSKITLEDQVWRKKERLFSLNQKAADFFHHLLLKTSFGEQAREYLKQRGINLEITEKFMLGYAPLSWRSLLRYLLKKNFSINEIGDSGLIVNDGGRMYDRFRGRLIFPIYDMKNQIIGFSGRLLKEEKNDAKYINTPETLIYRKRETLYGIHLAKEAIKKKNEVYLVEGEFDMIAPFMMGLENFVATKGTAVTKEQLMFLKRLTNRINLSLDSDLAGVEAMKKTIKESEGLGLELRVILLNFAKDPDEAVRKDFVQFKKTIKKPQPIYDFFIDLAIKNNPEETAFAKKNIVEEVAGIIDDIVNPIVREFYIKKISNLIGLSEKTIDQYFRHRRLAEKQKKTFSLSLKRKETEKREAVLEKYLLSQLLQENFTSKALPEIFSILEEKDFIIPAHGKIFTHYINYQQEIKKDKEKIFNIKSFISQLDQVLVPVFDEIYLYSAYRNEENLDLEKVIYEIKKQSLKRQIKELLKEEKKQEDEKKLKELNRLLSEIEKKMIKLSI